MPDHRPAAGTRVGALVAHVMRDTVVDLADAIATGGAPAADGAAALRTMETTIAAYAYAYASAALGRTVAVRLPTEGRCTASASDCAPSTSEHSLVRRRGLYGLTPQGA